MSRDQVEGECLPNLVLDIESVRWPLHARATVRSTALEIEEALKSRTIRCVYVNAAEFCGGETLQSLSDWLSGDPSRQLVLFQDPSVDRRLIARATAEVMPSARQRLSFTNVQMAIERVRESHPRPGQER